MRPSRSTRAGVGSGSSAELDALAAERLGRRRRAVRRELRALPASLQRGERVRALARGRWGMRGGLVLASDRRLLLLSRPLFPRRAQTLKVAYARLASVAGRVDGAGVRLRLQFADSTLWLELAPADAGQELAQLVAWRAGFGGVDVLPAPLLRPGEFTM